MAKFRIDHLEGLSRQLAFSPHDVRYAQMAAAEDLLHTVDPGTAYPLDFVIYRITTYHPRDVEPILLPGDALQHDLGMLIELVSESLDLCAADLPEPVLAIEDVCARFNVTSKTIQRWRRKGLPARRFIFADGKRRVGFLLSSVERFVAVHENQVAQTANVAQADAGEVARIVARAQRLVNHGAYSERELTRRIARRLGRSPLAILHILRKHDQLNPAQAILPKVAPALSPAQQAWILRKHERGISAKRIARRLRRPLGEVRRVLLDQRIEHLKQRNVRFIDDPLYHQDGAAGVIESLVSQNELTGGPLDVEARIPRDLPPYLAELYRVPLFTPARERAMFLLYNFRKFQFVSARRRLDPELAGRADVAHLEWLLAQATEVKNAIVQANLRLVVSVARKHLRAGLSLMELVSEGNITLMRAVEGFDFHKGHRFSTYATLALMKGFARAVPQMVAASRKNTGDVDMLAAMPDVRRATTVESLSRRDEVRHLLERLNDREREVVAAQFGLIEGQSCEELASRLALTPQRIRQIQKSAMAKLRAAAGVTM